LSESFVVLSNSTNDETQMTTLSVLFALVATVYAAVPPTIGMAAIEEPTTISNSSLSSIPLAGDTLVDVLSISNDEVDESNCALLGPLALGIQAAMGIIVLSS